jgi:dTDP-4-amino-4,6-dideoxygalactose transaminase
VVEDAAQALGSRYRGRPLGTLGDLGCFSFHETKNVICGEGGAIVVNNPRHVERAEIIREKGTNRSQFFRGVVDKYTWVDVGSSYLPSDLLAAFLCAQLEAFEEVQKRRKAIWHHYYYGLEGLERDGHLRLPRVPEHCEPNYHLFHILLENEAVRDRLMNHLRQEGILAVFHYVPLHDSPFGRRLGYQHGQLPRTEQLAGRLLRLPFYNGLSQTDQHEVIEAIRRFF